MDSMDEGPERRIEELRQRSELYSAIILMLLQEREDADFTVTGSSLNQAHGKIMLSFNYNKDTLTVSVVPDETKKIVRV